MQRGLCLSADRSWEIGVGSGDQSLSTLRWSLAVVRIGDISALTNVLNLGQLVVAQLGVDCCGSHPFQRT